MFVISVNLVVLCSLEKWFLQQHYVENHTCRKDVTLGFDVYVFAQSDNLRSNVTGGSTSVEKIFLDVGICSKSEINNNGVHGDLISHHDVFWFEVTMHDSVLVHVGKSLEQSSHKSFDF